MPIGSEKDRAAVEVFSAILGSGMSSKLFEEVREKRGLVYTVRSDLDIGKNYGYMVIFAGTETSKIEEVFKICKEEFEKMGSISEKELQEGKVQLKGNRRVENEGSNGTAIGLLLEEISGDANDYYSYDKKIDSVTLEDIKKIASISNFASFSLGP